MWVSLGESGSVHFDGLMVGFGQGGEQVRSLQIQISCTIWGLGRVLERLLTGVFSRIMVRKKQVVCISYGFGNETCTDEQASTSI